MINNKQLILLIMDDEGEKLSDDITKKNAAIKSTWLYGEIRITDLTNDKKKINARGLLNEVNFYVKKETVIDTEADIDAEEDS